MGRLFCFGHRGARGHEPENTLRSIRKGLELGAEGIEIDVYFVDGQLIVIHDNTLDRTTNGRGPVVNKTFAELRALDAGKGERIPTLAEVFDTVAHRAAINIELKGPHTAAPVAALIQDYVQRGWRYDEFLISSFDHAQLREIKRICPKLRLGALVEKAPPDLVALAKSLGTWSINPSKECVTAELVAEAHQQGLKVFVFTVNEPRDITRMEKLGVDGVFCDFPERVTGKAIS